MLRENNEFLFKKHDCSWMLIGWLECYDQKHIACFLYIYSCGIEYLLIQIFTAENWKCLLWEKFFFICCPRDRQKKKVKFLIVSTYIRNDLKSCLHTKMTKIMLYDFFFFWLNKIVNKRVSLSSIFLQCFVMKHSEILAVPCDFQGKQHILPLSGSVLLDDLTRRSRGAGD